MPTIATAEDREKLEGSPSVSESTDAELVERFCERRDEAAFAQLLQRHGPMVLGVCRRALTNEADVEDAFQATFLVLVRRANSIRPRNMVGNWLYGVAHNTALKARAMVTKRPIKERIAASLPKSESTADQWAEVQPLLDQELNALPAKYRTAIVLCDLEGKSLKDAARELDCPLGTVGTRVARGRRILAYRLSRRGVTLSVTALALMFSQQVASASVPKTLAASTQRAAMAYFANPEATEGAVSSAVASLTSSVLNSMLWARIRTATAVAAVSIAAVCLVVAFARPSRTISRAGTTGVDAPTAAALEQLQGTWVVASVAHAGTELSRDEVKKLSPWTFEGNRFRFAGFDKNWGNVELNPEQSPKQIDLLNSVSHDSVDGGVRRRVGIYQCDDNTLKICLSGTTTHAAVRPTSFASTGGARWTSVFILQRKSVDKFRGEAFADVPNSKTPR